MGTGRWGQAYPVPATVLLAGHFYVVPSNQVVRLLRASQEELLTNGRHVPSGYYEWEDVVTGEVTVAVPEVAYWTEVNAEDYRPLLERRLNEHGVTTLKTVPAVVLSTMLLHLDDAKSLVDFKQAEERSREERRLRQERYNAPLDQHLPPVAW